MVTRTILVGGIITILVGDQPIQAPPLIDYSAPQYHTPAILRNSLEDSVQAFVEAHKVIMEA